MNATRTFRRLLLLLSLTVIPLRAEIAAADLTGSERDITEGLKLTPVAAQQLQDRLLKTPDDLSLRIQLLVWYSSSQAVPGSHATERKQQILWLIQRHPETPVLGSPYATIDRAMDPDGFQAAAALWNQQLVVHPTDAAILRNAVNFFDVQDRPTAERLLKEGEALEPTKLYWPQALGQLYKLDARYKPQPERKQLAAAALIEFERALPLVTDDIHKSHLLDDLATTAFDTGDTNKAAAYAQQDLAFAASGKGNWNTGNAIHHGNIVLGRIAFQAGDIELAKHYLLEAGKTPGSPQLDSFGPNMALARDLLVKGQKDVVLQYFALCAKFWKSPTDLDAWTYTVKQGHVPDFGGNLIY